MHAALSSPPPLQFLHRLAPPSEPYLHNDLHYREVIWGAVQPVQHSSAAARAQQVGAGAEESRPTSCLLPALAAGAAQLAGRLGGMVSKAAGHAAPGCVSRRARRRGCGHRGSAGAAPCLIAISRRLLLLLQGCAGAAERALPSAEHGAGQQRNGARHRRQAGAGAVAGGCAWVRVGWLTER